MKKKQIFIVDDEPNIIKALKRALMNEDYDILSAESAEECLKLLEEHQVQLVISDESMPGMPGTEFLSIVRHKYPDIIRIMLTGKASIDAAMKAVNEGEIYRFFIKPCDNLELKLSIRHGLEKYEMEEEKRLLLGTIKVQSNELSRLEKQHPGITQIEEDESGAIILPELDSEELSSIMEWCRKKGKGEE